MSDVPAINQWVQRDSGVETDFTHLFSNPQNVALIEGDGALLFVWRGPGIYEVHSCLEQRGKAALRTVRAMLGLMRSHGATMFWAAVPTDSRHVIMFTRLLGWKPHGTAQLPHGHCQIFVGE